ncbi:hypothetical protein TNCV_2884791 [Trichonephila clavipes]|nr:hypothetical protein TNCV_2884791 [Trichonephila clavipes]
MVWCAISYHGRSNLLRIATVEKLAYQLNERQNLTEKPNQDSPDVRHMRRYAGRQALNGSAVPFYGRQCTMSSHFSCRTALRSEDIERMDWPARSPDLNPIENVWNFLGRRLAARTLPPVTIRASIGAARRMGSNASTTH